MENLCLVQVHLSAYRDWSSCDCFGSLRGRTDRSGQPDADACCGSSLGEDPTMEDDVKVLLIEDDEAASEMYRLRP